MLMRINVYTNTLCWLGVIYTGNAGDMSPPHFESIWLKCSEKSSEPRNVKGLFAQNNTCNAV